MPPAARHACALLVLTVAAVETLSAQGTLMQPVSTVTDAVFRSQWVGPQADRPELLGMVPTGEGIKPVEDMAAKVREGLWLGSLRISQGFGTGW